MPSVSGESKCFWGLLAAHFLSVLAVVAGWILWVPRMIALPEDLAHRIRLYPLLLIPVLVLLLVAACRWLRPLVRQADELREGRLPEDRATELTERAASYPYHAFTASALAILVLAATVGVVQTMALGTPLYLVLELFALACSFGLVFAMLSFFIGRQGTLAFLRGRVAMSAGFKWEPDLRRRLVTGVVCTGVVVWTVLGVMVFDRQTNLVASLLPDPGMQPDVGRTAVILALGGVLFTVITGALSSLAARDLSTDIDSVVLGLENLATIEMGATRLQLPVLSPDELGDLTSAFNSLAGRIVIHDSVVRKSARKAEEADKSQMEFFNVVSHDLRTPLHTIVGFSQLLLEGVEGELNSDQDEDVRNILNGAYHLLSLVDDVVDFTKMESGMMALSRREVDVGHVVREALEAASGLKGAAAVEVKSDVPVDLPHAFADETRLRQVLFNLLGNALKFTKEGMVCIRVRLASADTLTVMVEDTGPGIPESRLDRVFMEFEQVRPESGTGIKGTGLGLAITRRLVEMHGGKIWAANRPRGGAEFAFTLPVLRGQEAGT